MVVNQKDLFLKRSSLPGAGLGLFTRVDIPKGRHISEYKGRKELWKDVKHTDGYNAYLFRLNRKFVINALSYKKSLARYANDARGFGKITGIRNNSEYTVEGDKVYITSIRKIHAGEEILVPYGKAYWDLLKKVKAESARTT